MKMMNPKLAQATKKPLAAQRIKNAAPAGRPKSGIGMIGGPKPSRPTPVNPSPARPPLKAAPSRPARPPLSPPTPVNPGLVPKNDPFFKSKEFKDFEAKGGFATMDMYDSPYFGSIGSGSVGRAKDEAYRKFKNIPEPTPERQYGLSKDIQPAPSDLSRAAVGLRGGLRSDIDGGQPLTGNMFSRAILAGGTTIGRPRAEAIGSMKKGGSVPLKKFAPKKPVKPIEVKKAKGGSIDGIAQRGKTNCKMR